MTDLYTFIKIRYIALITTQDYFPTPYIRETFYPQIQEAMNLTNTQMGLLSLLSVALFLLFYRWNYCG